MAKRIVAGILMMCMAVLVFNQCTPKEKPVVERPSVPFTWKNATVYFLLTDRFNNGTTSNDVNFDRTDSTRIHRQFMGGDIQGITQKIKSGYFNDLGVDAIWLSPVAEQIHGAVDEGQGLTYAFHGYWAKDWTSFEPNYGSEADIHEMVETAHKNGIRVLFDVVLNQRGPVTDIDPNWPSDWVRTEPKCQYDNYVNSITCTLVENLPDLKTESEVEVEVPQILKDKWEKEGRLESELASLDAFFERTGYPRTPRYYMIKWLCDYILKFGVDGFRIDTVKHVEEDVWADLWTEAVKAFEDWKNSNPEKKWHDDEFYTVGEVYGYSIQGKEYYNYGDSVVNYFDHGFTSLINFAFKGDIQQSYDTLFSTYANYLHDSLNGEWVMNYMTSHDDSHSYDRDRKDPITAATKLLLTPGAAQIYYGDETARLLQIEEEMGDAQLRSFMNWEELTGDSSRNGFSVKDVLTHYQKLGKFRQANPAVGAGTHAKISDSPYVFSRTYAYDLDTNRVVIGLDLPAGEKSISVGQAFANGDQLVEHYSGQKVEVVEGKVAINSPYDVVLLGW